MNSSFGDVEVGPRVFVTLFVVEQQGQADSFSSQTAWKLFQHGFHGLAGTLVGCCSVVVGCLCCKTLLYKEVSGCPGSVVKPRETLFAGVGCGV